jgi:glycosyltransferase involved in cell wall biosynthesis
MTSVIIPTFNRAAFLREAIDSVLAQTAKDFELIVVDDGSTDHTRELVAEYGDRIRYLFQSNAGASAARNFGFHHAAGNFIAFLDSDDLWLPKKLARQMEWMAVHPNLLLCYTDEIWIRRGVRVNQKLIHAKAGGWIYPLCLPRCIISPSSVLMRRELFEAAGWFDEQLPVCEDYELWLRVASRFEVGFIPEPLIVKRGGHSDQLSLREWGNDRYRVTALRKIYASGMLDEAARKLTAAMICLKCRILENGFRKRQKLNEAKFYADLKEKFCQIHFDAEEKTEVLRDGA